MFDEEAWRNTKETKEAYQGNTKGKIIPDNPRAHNTLENSENMRRY